MEFSNTFSREKILAMDELNAKLLNKNNSPNNNLIFVYCPPKVGSTTLVSSIRLSAARKFNVIHIHDNSFFYALSNNPFISQISVMDLIIYNRSLGKNVYVIDIFRSPIERKISEFFEKISWLHFNNTEQNINNYNVERLIKRFNNIFPYLDNTDYYKELYNILQIPESFDFNKKYLFVDLFGIKFIKLRLKDSDSWGTILTEILDTQITIVSDYETSKKPLAYLFANFKNTYRIPQNFLNDIKNDIGLMYYYTQTERAEYFDMWEIKNSISYTPYTSEQFALYNSISLENQCQNIVQVEHYIDIGCLCMPCSRKRAILLEKAKCGEKIDEKIIHVSATNEVKCIIDKRNRMIQERVNKLNAIIQARNARLLRPSDKGRKVVKNNMKNIVINK